MKVLKNILKERVYFNMVFYTIAVKISHIRLNISIKPIKSPTQQMEIMRNKSQ